MFLYLTCLPNPLMHRHRKLMTAITALPVSCRPPIAKFKIELRSYQIH